MDWNRDSRTQTSMSKDLMATSLSRQDESMGAQNGNDLFRREWAHIRPEGVLGFHQRSDGACEKGWKAFEPSFLRARAPAHHGHVHVLLQTFHQRKNTKNKFVTP